jgi:hypothetical protein
MSKSKLLYDWRSVSQYVFPSNPVWDLWPDITSYLKSESCCLVSTGHPLWREDGSAVCSAITHWSESGRTHNHTLLSHLRLPKPGGPGSRTYIPQEQCGLVKSPGTGFPLRRLLRLAGLRWRYSNPPPTWRVRFHYTCIYPPIIGWPSYTWVSFEGLLARLDTGNMLHEYSLYLFPLN